MTTTKITKLDDRTLQTVTGGFALPFNPDELGPGPVIPPTNTVNGLIGTIVADAVNAAATGEPMTGKA